ncbi:hypothetical protein LLG96_02825 [bacterium]|nr:hypothetical protein [bacterium]
MTSSNGVLKISSASIGAYNLDFCMDITHSLASRSSSVNIFTTLETDNGLRGYGECVPRSYVTGETPESVMESLRRIVPEITGDTFADPGDVVVKLERLGMSLRDAGNPAALCAVELAVLDLAGKYWNTSVSDILGFAESDEPLFYSLVIPYLKGKTLEKFISHAAPYNFGHVKVKVDDNDPAGHVSRIRSLTGDKTEIRVDANCSWNRKNAPVFMSELADLGVVSVEQPLPPDDIEGMAAIRGKGLPLVTLDETVKNPGDVERVAAAGACDVVNVRISKCGGILGALRVTAAARKHGIGFQLGAHVGESCVLSAAGAHLAHGVSDFRWLEGCFGTHLLRKDLCDEEFRFGYAGRVDLPKGPGLGVVVSESRMNAARKYEEKVTSA